MIKEFNLDGVVPWGRRFDEYDAFFSLGDVPPGASVLDVAGGPASFAMEAAARGMKVTAADPIYRLDAEAIRRRFEETAEAMRRGMHLAAYRFNWSFYGTEAAVYRRRREALDLFLADFETMGGKRYVPASLPDLPFGEGAFDLALTSHFLFLYGDELGCDFHVAAIRELMRVAKEARIFPLANLDGRPSSHLPGVMRALKDLGLVPELVAVPFEFQRGATTMLRVRKI
ncbi:MAG: class I SAM-dependent methyltransferase [Parvibaculum sp.]|uniref:class I SAM-dependent methyltransferase n=1 Tax=Parvibaculum sp. TaxID=2024848 RepID=UPI00284784AC|nr:class I SAM-dependent methyltransferase [Parvibaculum sp.]MDR3499951.1 class I SAM-dependent methyltransferase [Parvibaculum sp.]